VRAELLEKILVCRGRSRNDACSARFCNLHRETPVAGGPAWNETVLSRLLFRHVSERLPRSQSAHRHRRGVYKVQSLGLCCNFPLLDSDELGPATSESRIAINRIAHFEFRDVCSRFLYDSGDFVTRNQWQVRAEFARIFPAERERVCWIDAAGNHAHESFIFVRLRSRDLFKF